MPERFLPIAEVQHIAGDVSRATVWRWSRIGILPKPVALGPKKRGWRQSELRDWAENPRLWVENHRVTTASVSRR